MKLIKIKNTKSNKGKTNTETKWKKTVHEDKEREENGRNIVYRCGEG